MTKVAVVTGSNKGIGLAIVRGLCKSFEGDVYLTSRDQNRGQQAVELLEKEGLKPKYHQLDICDIESIRRLREFMTSRYGGIDVLINNVGIAFKNSDPIPFGEESEITMKTNYHATVTASNELFPIVKPGGRIVNVSSMLSLMNLKKCSAENQAFFRSNTITEEELNAKMEDFVQHAKKGDHVKAGYTTSPYGMSKVGMTTLTRIWARRLKAEGKDIIINACCPGWVKTDLGGKNASKTQDEGAITPLYLATLPQGTQSPYGELVSDKNIREW